MAKRNRDLSYEFNRLNQLIASNHSSIKLVDTNQRHYSDVWKKYKRVFENEKETDFVKCSSCSAIFANNKSSGTTTLRNHSIKCDSSKDKKQRKLEDVLPAKITATIKKEVAKSAALFMSQDMRPLSTLDGTGIRQFLQTVIDVTKSTQGSLKIDDLLVCRKTITKSLKEIYVDKYNRIKDSLKSIKYLSATTDHWRHSQTKRCYMCVTVQYLKNGQMINHLLSIHEVESKTTSATHDDFFKIIREFNIDDKLSIIVTDNVNSNKSAFMTHGWIGCGAHQLNLVLKHAFNIDKNSDEWHIYIGKLMDKCQAFVAYVRKSDVKFGFKPSIKQHIEVRWDSRLDMIESIYLNEERIKSLSQTNSRIRELSASIDFSLLKSLVEILKPFKQLRMQISQDKTSTINLMAPAKQKLIELTNEEADDNLYARLIKSRLSIFINSKIEIDLYHHISSFLTPKFRNLSYIKNDMERDILLEKVQKFIIDHSKVCQIVEESDPEEEVDDDDDLFKSVSDQQEKNTVNHQFVEFDKYKEHKFTNEDIKMPAEKFWYINQTLYPVMLDLSLYMLSIPTTSCTSERRFNDAGWTMNDRRCQLDPKNINHLLLEIMNN